MIGCYDFCGHYEWTFDWLDREGGHDLLKAYWNEAINLDSQIHARELIIKEGFDGMAKYWGHTLAEESPDLGFNITKTPEVFRIDMHDCTSKGFLLKNGLEQYRDYCDHCIGWIGPLMKDAGFVIDHEHNHCGQCWWEMRREGSLGGHAPTGSVAGEHDVRVRRDWNDGFTKLDGYVKTTDPDGKISPQL